VTRPAAPPRTVPDQPKASARGGSMPPVWPASPRRGARSGTAPAAAPRSASSDGSTADAASWRSTKRPPSRLPRLREAADPATGYGPVRAALTGPAPSAGAARLPSARTAAGYSSSGTPARPSTARTSSWWPTEP